MVYIHGKKINPSKTKCLIHLKPLNLFSAFNKGEDNCARRGILEYLYNNTPVSVQRLLVVLSLGEGRDAQQTTGKMDPRSELCSSEATVLQETRKR